jgi:hypothetical protein
MPAELLKKTLSRFINQPVHLMTDHEIHGHAVQSAAHAGQASRWMQKALDHTHDLSIQRYAKLNSDTHLLGQWVKDFEMGDVAGAYWALMTHASISQPLLLRIFGDVHMLSHQAGAMNRSDMKNLADLQIQVRELKAELELERLHHRERVAKMEKQVHDVRIETNLQQERLFQKTLREQENFDWKKEKDEMLLQYSNEQQRHRKTQQNLVQLKADLATTLHELRSKESINSDIRKELAAMERHFSVHESDRDNESDAQILSQQTVLYVGGLPSVIPHVKNYVEKMGGQFLHHDGGIEENTQQLQQWVLKSDVVAFPVDCISHDSMHLVKAQCIKLGRVFIPLRTRGLGSFVSALGALQSKVTLGLGPSANPM